MDIKHLKQAIFLLSCFFSIQSIAETLNIEGDNKSAPLKTAGVPPGFQFLLEKQTTAIDVFYGDVYIATTLATYSPSTVEFHNPEEVVSGLKNLISPEMVAKNLTGEIDSHVGEVCVRSADADCGVISPDTVGVIFDEGRFRADLFINPNLLAVQDIDFNRYLPASTSDFSSINNLALLYSGEDSGGVTTSLNGQSLFSLREQRVISDWSYGSSGVSGVADVFNMRTLYWQLDKPDDQYQAGWFYSDSRYLSFMPNLNILGFRYSTSFKARTDLNFAMGTQMQLYLPSKSRINIYKDGTFVSTGFYDPGNQTIDTSTLPDGAYDVELRIVDSVGREERITRFFVKTQRLAPVDQDLYFMEGGDVQLTGFENEFPVSQKVPLLQAGYSHRLAEKLGLNLGGSVVDSHLLAETGLYYLNGLFDFEPKLLVGNNQVYGWSANTYARLHEWGFFYQGRRLWSGDTQDPIALDPVTGQPVHANTFRFSVPALKQQIIGVSRGMWGGYMQFNYSSSKRYSEPVSEVVSLTYGRPFEFNSNNFVFSSELSKSDKDKLILFSLNWSFSQGNTRHTFSGAVLQEQAADSAKSDLFRVAYGGDWYDNELRRGDFGVQWDAQADNEKVELGLSTDYRGPYIGSQFGVNYLEGSRGVSSISSDSIGTENVDQNISETALQYSGVLSTVLGGEKGNWGVGGGGRSSTQAAVVVEVEVDDDQAREYDLYINDLNFAKVYAGKKMVIPLVPYKNYTLYLADKGSEFVSFDKTTERVTVYPGNVKHIKWKARSVGVLVGRVVRKIPGCFNDNDQACWQPLVVGRAKNVHGIASTDSDGFIQVEVFRGEKSFTMIKKGEECVVDYSQQQFTEGVAYSEQDLKCMDVAKPDMNLDVRKSKSPASLF